jgi:hypothetical protein
VWQELQQINVDFNTCSWVTNQGKVSAVGAKRVTELENAFGYEVIRLSDIALGFNRNMIYNQRTGEWKTIDEEYNPEVVRAFLMKNRGRPDKFEMRWACNLDKSQIYSRSATEVMTRSFANRSVRGRKRRKYTDSQTVLDDE